MAAHFAGTQGFSIATLDARREWFTDSLRALLREDLGDGTALGFLSWDPFTAAQDSAAGYAFRESQVAGDTVLVRFRIVFDSSFAPDVASDVTLAMRWEQGLWRIADFVSDSRSLASGIRATRPTPTP